MKLGLLWEPLFPWWKSLLSKAHMGAAHPHRHRTLPDVTGSTASAWHEIEDFNEGNEVTALLPASHSRTKPGKLSSCQHCIT